MLPTIWGVYISWRYMLILDISCQHLGDDCKLEGFCVPFGHRVWNVHLWKNIFVLDICCQQFGEYVSVENIWVCIGYIMPTIWGNIFGGFLCALRAQSWGMYIFENYHFIGYMLPTIWRVCVSWIYMLVLDISCQHLVDKYKLEDLCVPCGHRVKECIFENYHLYWL